MSGIFKIDFADFFIDLAAALNIIPTPSLKLIETDTESGLAEMEAHGGPIPFICCDGKSNPFFQGGIRRQTHSFAGHAGIFVGNRNAQIIRSKVPALLKPRPLAGFFTDHDAVLPPVPKTPKPHEVIESSTTVVLTEWPDTIHPGIQAVAFLRDWTDAEIGSILESAYRMYGAPYDIIEIVHDVFPLIPNPNQINACSSFTTRHIAKGDPEIIQWMKARHIDPDSATPSDVGKYFFGNPTYRPIAFRCDLDEARKKI